MVAHHVALGEVEERIMLQQRVLEVIALDRGNGHVRSNAAAAVNCAAAVSEFHFTVGVVGIVDAVAVVIIVVERNVAVVALNQASAGRVVARRGQRQSSVFGQWIYGLHQSLAEGDFAHDQAAVMILNCAGNNFGGGSCRAVDQHYDGIIFSAIAVLRDVALLGRCAAMVRNDKLTPLQEFVSHADALTEQTAGIAAQVEDQALQIAELIERVGDFVFRGFVESADVHVSEAGLDEEMNVHAVARNLVADQREIHGLLDAFARNADVDGGAFGSLQQIGDVAGAHVFGGLAVDGNDHVAGMNAGLICGRPHKGENHDDLVVAWSHGHAYAVVFAALVFAHQGIGLWIEEIRVRIEGVEHARNRAVVDGLVRVHRLGVVLLYDGVDVSELLQAVFDVGIAGKRRLLSGTLGKQDSEEATDHKEKSDKEERPASTTCHEIPSD